MPRDAAAAAEGAVQRGARLLRRRPRTLIHRYVNKDINKDVNKDVNKDENKYVNKDVNKDLALSFTDLGVAEKSAIAKRLQVCESCSHSDSADGSLIYF